MPRESKERKERKERAEHRKERDETSHAGQFMIRFVPLVILLVLVIFMVVQFAGERLGIFPYIYIATGPNSLFSNDESVLLFVVSLGISLFLAMILARALIHKARNEYA
jgi:cell division septal protein FtsQ